MQLGFATWTGEKMVFFICLLIFSRIRIEALFPFSFWLQVADIWEGKISAWKAHLPWKMRMSQHRTKCCRIMFFITSGKTVWKLDRLCKSGELSLQHWGDAEGVCRYCNSPHAGTNFEELFLIATKICKYITQFILGPVLRDFYNLLFSAWYETIVLFSPCSIQSTEVLAMSNTKTHIYFEQLASLNLSSFKRPGLVHLLSKRKGQR